MNKFFSNNLDDVDGEISSLIEMESQRQKQTIELIASENIVSKAVLQAQGSILTNKYAEGYPNKRYYGGCNQVDKIEQVAIDRACDLFNSRYANVQPHSGSQANMGVYMGLLNIGDCILGMDLNAGGHLTHGSKVSFSGKIYKAIHYSLNENTMQIDYDLVEQLAIKHKPSLIIAGGSSYSRIIDFKRFREISDKVGAYLLVDMAHFAGMVATGDYPSPLPYAHIVTSTTHKTLRGPRGGLILSNDESIIKKINSSIFPGSQGGPMMHTIAAKATAFAEAKKDSYKSYIKQVLINSDYMANKFQNIGYNVISGGTDTHLFMLDLSHLNINGKQAETILDSINITCNKNSLPFDKLPPSKTSGIRIGTPAITTRGFKENECSIIVDIIDKAFKNINIDSLSIPDQLEEEMKISVNNLCISFPIY